MFVEMDNFKKIYGEFPIIGNQLDAVLKDFMQYYGESLKDAHISKRNNIFNAYVMGMVAILDPNSNLNKIKEVSP